MTSVTARGRGVAAVVAGVETEEDNKDEDMVLVARGIRQ